MQLEPEVDGGVIFLQVLQGVAEEVSPPEVHEVPEPDEELRLALHAHARAEHVQLLEPLELEDVREGGVLHLLRSLHVQDSQRAAAGFRQHLKTKSALGVWVPFQQRVRWIGSTLPPTDNVVELFGSTTALVTGSELGTFVEYGSGSCLK